MLDASPAYRHAIVLVLPIFLRFRWQKKAFSQSLGQFLAKVTKVSMKPLNELKHHILSHFLKSSRSRAVAFVRIRLLASNDMVVECDQDFVLYY
jgi:hypothetical protein